MLDQLSFQVGILDDELCAEQLAVHVGQSCLESFVVGKDFG
jgi:hypothetical protein